MNQLQRWTIANIVKTIIPLLVISGSLLLANPVQADCPVDTKTTSKHIVLSEILPSPASGDEEYIELYNNGKQTVDVAGWKLKDASGKIYALDPDDVGKTTIKPDHYLVILYSASHIYLNNSGDSVTLLQANDKQRSSASYTDATTGAAWARIKGTWQWTATATKGKTNLATTLDSEDSTETEATETTSTATDTTYATSDDLLLSELLPNPSGSDSTDEWIELVNNGAEAIDVAGWEISDSSKSYTLDSQSVAAGGYLQLPIGTTGLSLNNGGETIELTDPFGTVIDSTTYDAAGDGEAWARITDDWGWTTSPTAGTANQLTTEAAENTSTDPDSASTDDNTAEAGEASSIEAFRALSEDATGTVSGVVTVQPGILGSQYFYIQDATAGIQVYSYHKDFPDLSIGDTVSVTGVLSSSRGESRIKTSTAADITVTGTSTVKTKTITDPGEGDEGMLVKIAGTITASSSTAFEIDGTVQGVIKSTTGVSKDDLVEGDALTVTGIIGQSGDSYRLMPRANDDIQNTSTDGAGTVSPTTTGATLTDLTALPASAANRSWQWVILSLLIALTAASAWLWRSPAGRAWLKHQLARFQPNTSDTTLDTNGALFFHPSAAPTTTSSGSIILPGSTLHKKVEK